MRVLSELNLFILAFFLIVFIVFGQLKIDGKVNFEEVNLFIIVVHTVVFYIIFLKARSFHQLLENRRKEMIRCLKESG